jgi:hypothetical protein
MSTPSQQAIQAAQAVLAKCNANDPWFPKPSQATVLAWAEHFMLKNYPLEDLLAAVTLLYQTKASGFRPLPGDILGAAAGIRNDRLMREADEEREARENERDKALERSDDVVALVGSSAFSVPFFSRGPNPLLVACGWCGAGSGSRCIIPGTGGLGKKDFHPSRVEAAKLREGK